MNIDEEYETKILRMVVNQYLNKNTSPTKESIKALENNPDEAVWELATNIYKESGHKVELCMVRNMVNFRITDLKYQLEKLEIEKKARAEAEKKARAEAEMKARAEAEMKAELARKALADFLQEIGGEDRANIFFKLRKIIGNVLRVDESKVNIQSHLLNDLSTDDRDLLDLMFALEEEFEIEISDSFQEDGLHWTVKDFLNFICAKVSVSTAINNN